MGSHDFFFRFNIFIFIYFFKYKTIETHARSSLALNISAVGSVGSVQKRIEEIPLPHSFKPFYLL